MTRDWGARWRLREGQLFLLLTIVVGVLAGLLAVLFALSIDLAQHHLLGSAPGASRLILVPVAGSIVAGVLLAKVFGPDARGSGVPQTKAAYHLRQGYIPGRVPIGKFLMGVLCIGSGHSLGREGPSVQIGAGLASAVGQWLRLPQERRQTLVPVGISAALAAAFNTPVAAVLFTLEEIISDMNAPLLGSTVVASVAAVMVSRSILGNEPLFHVPEYQLAHPAELIGYCVLGIIGGLASVAFCKGLLATRRFFLNLPARTKMWQPAMGGLIIGFTLVVVPEVAGVGYAQVDAALNGGLLIQTLAVLLIVKMGATIVSYASGNAGGIFAPTLFLGAMLGGLVGLATQMVAPFPVGEPGAYALVGMGALFAGIIRAPMTSVFMIFELTQDYQILVPLMVANLLSLFISRRFQPVPVYTALLHQDHVFLPDPQLRKSAGGWRAGDVMTTEVHVVPSATSTEQALALAADDRTGWLLVGTRESLDGLVGREDLERTMGDGLGAQAIDASVRRDWIHVHPDHGMDVVLERYRRCPGVLPVMSRSNDRYVEGVITAETLARVFGQGVDREARPGGDAAPASP